MQSLLTILSACTASPIERKTQLASLPHWCASLERRPERTSDPIRELLGLEMVRMTPHALSCSGRHLEAIRGN